MSGEGSHSKYDGPDGPLPDLGPDDLDSILEHAGEGQSETPEASKETELEFKIGTRVNLLRSPRKKGDSRKLEFDWVVTDRFDEERPKHIVVGKPDEKGDYVATKAVNPNNLKNFQSLDDEVFEPGRFHFDTEELKAEIELLNKQHRESIDMARMDIDEERKKSERALFARIERLTTLLETRGEKK